MSDLIEFVRARLDEDEKVALDVPGARRWSSYIEGGDDGWAVESDFVEGDSGEDDPPGFIVGDEHVAAHIVHYDPARVLREIEAKRRIIALHTRRSQQHTFSRILTPAFTVELWTCDVCCRDVCPTWEELGEDHRDPSLIGCCETLPLLALPYADHPDYQESWRP